MPKNYFLSASMGRKSGEFSIKDVNYTRFAKKERKREEKRKKGGGASDWQEMLSHSTAGVRMNRLDRFCQLPG